MPDIDPRTEFAAALRDERVDDARLLLLRHPNLRAGLNEPIPGGAFGAEPLLVAVQRKNREMVDLLVSAGADINGKSDWWAGGFGLLEGCDADFAPFLIERGATIYPNAAAKLAMLDALRSLIAADPAAARARGGDGQTPLHVAATVEIAQALLDAGAEIDALDVDHESTPAQYAIGDRTEVARFLASRGARVDILLACALGEIARVRRILDDDPAAIGVAVDAEHFPMRDARAGGHIYTWTLGDNKTPHAVAKAFGHQDVLDLLMLRTPDDLRLGIAYQTGDDKTAAALVAGRPNVAASLSPAAQRVLVESVQANDAAAVRRLLRAGWPTAAHASGQATALHWASYRGNAEIVRDLLASHAGVDAREDRFGGTPLGWALHGALHAGGKRDDDYLPVVEALLAAGAAAPEMAEPSTFSPVLVAAIRRARAI
ncbi:MAG TPA: ankyrin repeat domain-containing protein [Gemmatimonadaceae bacterium]|nr:ankyrin repeat domain-containing protein [Gemmatimonadaceae bacterium]